ncbi:hypothetical protein [Achromobacter spanius]|uniref:hypothetical protein n=1 Tax=Achromobacter spanius TaxID=217203 RepID=UPI001F54067E|nr:hypothetical protein [Achromobacter spanius]
MLQALAMAFTDFPSPAIVIIFWSLQAACDGGEKTPLSRTRTVMKRRGWRQGIARLQQERIGRAKYAVCVMALREEAFIRVWRRLLAA